MSTCINYVWEEFSVPLKRFIIKRVANEQDADDILQDILVEAVNGNIKFVEKKKEDKKEKP